jgi:hypothetical protein
MSEDRTPIAQFTNPLGQIANVYLPSVALSERLCEIKEQPPSRRDHAALSVMDAVVVHCTSLPTLACAAPIPQWPSFVLSILETWPDDPRWRSWRGFVLHCVKNYADELREFLEACSPRAALRVLEEAEEDGAQSAREWLSRAAEVDSPGSIARVARNEGENPPRTAPTTLRELAALVRREKPKQSAVARLLDLMHDNDEVTFETLQERVHLADVDDDAIKAKIKVARQWIKDQTLPFQLVISDRRLSRRERQI